MHLPVLDVRHFLALNTLSATLKISLAIAIGIMVKLTTVRMSLYTMVVGLATILKG